MNMQDYRHAADRVQIADHCKEEVLGMKENTAARKPVIRIATGITAAAACLAVTGICGYTLMHMKQQSTEFHPAASIEEQITEALPETESEPEPAEAEIDDREFPLFDRMTEEQRTKTFDWGTITLDSMEKDEEDNSMMCAFHLHFNDSSLAKYSPSVTLDGWAYDSIMQHKVGRNIADGYYAVKTDEDADNNVTFVFPFPALNEETKGLTVMSLDDDGEFHEAENDDILMKEPDPEYMLYELILKRIELYDPESGETTVLMEADDTPLFKCRTKDIEAEISKAYEQAIAEMDEEIPAEGKEAPIIEDEQEPAAVNLLTEPVTQEYSFGTVTLEDAYFMGTKFHTYFTFVPADWLKEKDTANHWLNCEISAIIYDQDGVRSGVTLSDSAFPIEAPTDETPEDHHIHWHLISNVVSSSNPDQSFRIPAGSKVEFYVSGVDLGCLHEADETEQQEHEYHFRENMWNNDKTEYDPFYVITMPYDAP